MIFFKCRIEQNLHDRLLTLINNQSSNFENFSYLAGACNLWACCSGPLLPGSPSQSHRQFYHTQLYIRNYFWSRKNNIGSKISKLLWLEEGSGHIYTWENPPPGDREPVRVEAHFLHYAHILLHTPQSKRPLSNIRIPPRNTRKT